MMMLEIISNNLFQYEINVIDLIEWKLFSKQSKLLNWKYSQNTEFSFWKEILIT